MCRKADPLVLNQIIKETLRPSHQLQLTHTKCRAALSPERLVGWHSATVVMIAYTITCTIEGSNVFKEPGGIPVLLLQPAAR